MADEASEAVTEKAKGRKVYLWIIIGAVILLVSGYGGFSFIKYYQSSPAPEGGSTLDTASDGEMSSIEKVKSTMNLEAFLVNLADQESVRFVKVTFRLGINQPNLGEEFAEDPVVLAATRDKIISILSTKTSDQILTPEGKDRLRAEIREGVNAVMPEGKVVEVFIMDFVVQL